MEEITKIKDLRPGMQHACIQGTVVEVTPVEDRPTPPKGEPRKKASFVVQDETGQVRVVVMGNYCRDIKRERIDACRPVKILWARVRRGASGEPEILVHRHLTDIKGLPTAEEEKQQEEWLRWIGNEGVQMPTRWITRDQYPELYEAVPVTIKIPRGMLEFAKTLAAQQGMLVEELLARKLDPELEWEFHPPNQ